jgi:hypothetical protein
MRRMRCLRRALIRASLVGGVDGAGVVSGRGGGGAVGRARARAVVLVLAVSLAGLVGACGGRAGPPVDPRGSTASPPPGTATATPTGSALPSPPPTLAPLPRPPVKPARSAADDLAPFFAAAGSADERIRAAARAVNRGVGRGTIHFDRSILEVTEASLPGTARAIPAGMDPDLLRAVLLVHSELVARSAAFNWVSEFTYQPVPVTDHESVRLLDGFAAGSVIAKRYPADLAALRALAKASPPIRAARPDSRQAAELALQIAWINGQNNGCASNGGYVFTALQPIIWKTIVTDYGRFDGTIAWIRFTVTYSPSTGWKAELNAC